jgi:DNA-binding response OmpR family regulator
LKVLVVDDHPDAANIACILLTALGHECRSATCGRAGLEAAVEFRPELAILDIGMPDVSGYEVAVELRKRLGDNVFLVAMTGWGQPEDRARAFAAGFDRHVLKPADADILIRLIEDARRAHAPAAGNGNNAAK